MARLICFVTGGLVYVTSFFLPAVNGLRGWMCYVEAMSFLKSPATLINPFAVLLLASGLLNPVILVYAWHWISGGPTGHRRTYALSAIPLILASGLFLAAMHLDARGSIRVDVKIQAGYLAWVGGILFMVGWDVRDAALELVSGAQRGGSRC